MPCYSRRLQRRPRREDPLRAALEEPAEKRHTVASGYVPVYTFLNHHTTVQCLLVLCLLSIRYILSYRSTTNRYKHAHYI